jgi:hypothetical protein
MPCAVPCGVGHVKQLRHASKGSQGCHTDFSDCWTVRSTRAMVHWVGHHRRAVQRGPPAPRPTHTAHGHAAGPPWAAALLAGHTSRLFSSLPMDSLSICHRAASCMRRCCFSCSRSLQAASAGGRRAGGHEGHGRCYSCTRRAPASTPGCLRQPPPPQLPPYAHAPRILTSRRLQSALPHAPAWRRALRRGSCPHKSACARRPPREARAPGATPLPAAQACGVMQAAFSTLAHGRAAAAGGSGGAVKPAKTGPRKR